MFRNLLYLKQPAWNKNAAKNSACKNNFSRTMTKISKDSPEIEKRLVLNPKIMTTPTLLPSAETKQFKLHWKRNPDRRCHHCRCEIKYDFSDVKAATLGERGALKEAARCLKCADAPCSKSCPAQIDVKAFISCIANKNYYGAAKIVFSDNPLGISCGMVCPVSDLCEASCNLHASEEGPIKIGGLQQFATDVFSRMGVKQTMDPSTCPPEGHARKIFIVGAGPSGLSCASYLARLGYTNITIFERQEYAGGLSAGELPNFRLSIEAVNHEVAMVKELRVKFKHGRWLCTDDLTVERLMRKGASAIYLAIGLPQPNTFHLFDSLTPEMGFYTAKDFMPLVAKGSKPGLCSKHPNKRDLPKLCGNVVVLGAGDTAFDCATSALRCGAAKVFIVFRDGVSNIKAVPEEVALAIKEKCDFLPFLTPHSVRVENKHIVSCTFARYFESGDTWVTDTKQLTTLQADFIIAAFGSGLHDKNMIKALSPLELTKRNLPVIDPKTYQTSMKCVFCGGDMGGIAEATVDAVNDGKNAAWHMHCYLQDLPQDTPPCLPLFHTEIDEVDISVNFCGLKFDTPFGLASGPSTTSAAMIRRAFEQGWSFAITKSIVLDKDLQPAVSPKVLNADKRQDLGPGQSQFVHFEEASDKCAEYWCQSIAELKKDFPDKVIIASIKCSYREEDWCKLAQMMEACCVDALELNLIAPVISDERLIRIAQKAELVYKVCTWVRRAVNIPFFAKLTPNVLDIAEIAIAAKCGGAFGVSAINSLAGVTNIHADGTPMMAVGQERLTAVGGVSGSVIRSIALRATISIAKALPNFPILATGGIGSADTAFQFLQGGATLCQVSSAVQNHDFTIIQDFVSGLRALLFLDCRLPGWDGQSPPTYNNHKGKYVCTFRDSEGEVLPWFGKYRAERTNKMACSHLTDEGEIVSGHHSGIPDPPPRDKSVRVPKLRDVIGRSVDYVVDNTNLDAAHQVVAQIAEVNNLKVFNFFAHPLCN